MNSLRILCLSFLVVLIAAGSITADEFSCPFPTVTRCKDNSYEFSYAPDNPEEVHRNSSVTIKAIGGRPPYSWRVSGKGFSLGGPAQTNEPVNSIVADSTACGSADISIKDKCRDIFGSVRCSDSGKWVALKPNICFLPGKPTQEDSVVPNNGRWVQIKIQGKLKQVQEFISNGTHSGGPYSDNQGKPLFERCEEVRNSELSKGDYDCTRCEECLSPPKTLNNSNYAAGKWRYSNPCSLYSNAYYWAIYYGVQTSLQAYEWVCQ